MPYNDKQFQLSTQKWKRIWFSPDPTEFMPQLNKARTIKFLKNNPDRHLTIVYSSALLNEEGLDDLQRLQKEIAQLGYTNISFSDFCSPQFKSALYTDEQRMLHALAEIELEHLYSGGNPAAASDMGRLLPPYDIYTDFDVTVNSTSKEPIEPELFVSQPFMWSSTASNSRCCNDAIVITSSEESDLLLRQVGEKIIEGYQQPFPRIKSSLIEAQEQSIFYNEFVELAKAHLVIDAPREGVLFFEPARDHKKAAKQLMQFRHQVEKKMRSTEDFKEFSFWMEIFKNSVMAITGPTNFLLLSQIPPYNEDLFIASRGLERTKLKGVIQAQIQTGKNDHSWLPDCSRFRSLSANSVSESEDDNDSSFSAILRRH